jgi:putative endopeptidase
MRLALLYSLLAIAMCAPLALPQTARQTPIPAPVTSTHFGMENLDLKADPCVDFYQYSCGGWMAANPLPADEVYWDTSKQLQRRNETILHDVLDKVSSDDPNRSIVQREIGDYYAACMDEKRREAEGLRTLEAELDRIAGIKDKHSLASALAHLHQILLLSVNGSAATTVWDAGSYEPIFGFFRLGAFDDASQVIATADQGGLGLPDRDYYLKQDKKSVQLRGEYLQHIRNTLALARYPSPDQAASRVLQIETALARGWMDVVKRRNPHNLNHNLSLEQLQALMPSFDWKEYLRTLNVPVSPRYLITAPEFFAEVNRLLEAVPLVRGLEDIPAMAPASSSIPYSLQQLCIGTLQVLWHGIARPAVTASPMEAVLASDGSRFG